MARDCAQTNEPKHFPPARNEWRSEQRKKKQQHKFVHNQNGNTQKIIKHGKRRE